MSAPHVNKAPGIAVVSATMAAAFVLALAAVLITSRSKRRAARGAAPINTLELRGVTCVAAPCWAKIFSRRGAAAAETLILDNLSLALRRGQLVAMRTCLLSRP